MATPSDNSSTMLVLYDTNIVPSPSDQTQTQPHKTQPQNSYTTKLSLTQLLRGGAITEARTLHQCKLAESSGARAISLTSPDNRMPEPTHLKSIKAHLTIPVIAQCRVGHFVEAQIMESSGSDYIDENERLMSADEDNFINKHNFAVPFSCGARDLGEALCRVREGAAMVRVSGGPNLHDTVRAVRRVMGEVRGLGSMDEDEVFGYAKRIGAPYDLLKQTKQMGRLPVVVFADGGIVTPADAALMMQLGCDGVVVGKEVWDEVGPGRRVRGIVEAVRCYNDADVLARVSSGLDGEVTSEDTRVVEV